MNVNPYEHPSQFRSGIDHVYTALSSDEQKPLAGVVEAASGLPRQQVQRVLKLAKKTGAADGANGKWSRDGRTRTAFRASVVRAALSEHPEATLSDLMVGLAGLASRSQVSNSLRVLMKQGGVEKLRREGDTKTVYIAS